VLALAWLVLGLDSVLIARRTRAARAALGPVTVNHWQPPAALGPLVVVVLLVGIWALEHYAGRFTFRPWQGALGLVLVGCGLWLHAVARRALGAHWSRAVGVRHPIYIAVMLLGLGSFLAHPSLARASIALGLAVGLALKIRLEERALREAFGEEWDRYAARVPALVPRGWCGVAR
jgi:protein-S-isoprenylcysteine O-methyltransferase Ste14